jgi:hypothetical protein
MSEANSASVQPEAAGDSVEAAVAASVSELDPVSVSDVSGQAVFQRPEEAWVGLLPPTPAPIRGRGPIRGRPRRRLTE